MSKITPENLHKEIDTGESILEAHEWQIKAIQQGVDAARRGEFASEDQVRRAFSKWGVYDDLSEEILKDLIRQGYSDNELLAEFQRRRAGIRPAVKQMLDEAYRAAENIDHSSSPKEQLAKLFSDDSGKEKI